jgi:hypothetical protein
VTVPKVYPGSMTGACVSTVALYGSSMNSVRG